jgi:hypothetical protein
LASCKKKDYRFLKNVLREDVAEEARTSRKKASGRREDSKTTMTTPTKEMYLNLPDRGDLTPVAEEVPTPEKSLSRKSSGAGEYIIKEAIPSQNISFSLQPFHDKYSVFV